jgi:hypothetical protein
MLTRTSPWSAKLSRPITLKDGITLATLSDARGCLIAHFDSVVRSAPLANAIELLLAAAEKPTPKNRRAATEQVDVVVRSRGLLA